MVSPAHALYLPVAHSWHVLPLDGWYWPGSQSGQSIAPACAYVPAGHAVQDAALYSALNLPTAHAVQACSGFVDWAARGVP